MIEDTLSVAASQTEAFLMERFGRFWWLGIETIIFN